MLVCDRPPDGSKVEPYRVDVDKERYERGGEVDETAAQVDEGQLCGCGLGALAGRHVVVMLAWDA